MHYDESTISAIAAARVKMEREDNARSHPNDPRPTLPAGRLEFAVALSPTGWRLGADCFVLPIGEDGTLAGDTYRALVDGPDGPGLEAMLKSEIHGGFSPETPILLSGLPPPRVGQLIVATAYRRQGPVEPGIAARAVIRLAAENGLRHIAMPILGATALRPEVALPMVLLGLQEGISQTGATIKVTFVVVEASVRRMVADAVGLGPETATKRKKKAKDAEAASSRRQRNHFANDSVDGGPVDDRLNVALEAEVFGNLLASKEASLPIAIGLFGKWGSGKSFFMKLIHKAMDDQAKAERLRPTGTVHAEVAHITFNAWHYLDSHLWASLALRIFEGVAEKISGQPGSASETVRERRRLVAQIESSRRLRAEAEAAIDQATRSRARQEEEIGRWTTGRGKLARWVDLDYLERQFGKEWRVQVRTLAASIGCADPRHLADIELALGRIAGTSGTLEGLLPGCLLRLSKPVRVVAVVLLAAMAVPLLDYWAVIETWVQTQVWASFRVPAAAGWLGGVATAASWTAHRLDQLKQARDRLGTVAARLRTISVTDRDFEKDSVAAFDDAILASREHIRQAEAEISAATTRLQQVDSGVLVYDFLNQRILDSRYVGATGIVSILRQDLQQLEARLEDLNKGNDRSKVQRIVLYIDDLDRCDPARVVEVLQAVHLLLAFKLFAVVVAVDPRWLERSLYQRYLPGFESMTDEQLANSDFSPQNYLEKIFQIPYRIRPLDSKSYRPLVLALSEKKDDPPPQPVQQEQRFGSGTGMNQPAPNVEDGLPEKPYIPIEERAAHLRRIVSASPKLEPEVKRYASPPPLELHDHEREALACVGAFIATPRAAKRLVNVYVLIRLQVAKANSELYRTLIARDGNAARVLVILLSIDIGYPRFTQFLRASATKHQTTLVGAIRAQDNRAIPGAVASAQAQRVLASLASVGAEIGATDFDIGMNEVRPWLPYIDRFSFHDSEEAALAPSDPSVKNEG